MSIQNKPLPTQTGHYATWENCPGAAASLAIANSAQAHSRLHVVITPDTQSARQLQHELRFFLSDETLPILRLPDWETLPYDHFSPHQDIISERLAALNRVPHLQKGIFIVPLSTLLHRLPPKEYVTQHSLLLSVGDTLNPTPFTQILQKKGYHCVSQVMEHGEFSVRGSLIDIFPMGSREPFRIDLFDDVIDSLRTFDPDNQRTREKIEHIRLLPAKEFPLSEEGIAKFRQAWRTTFSSNPLDCPLYESVSKGQRAPGLEYYFPLFFDETHTLFDYLPDGCVILRQGQLNAAAEHLWQDIRERHEQLRHDVRRPILPPQTLFVPIDTCFGEIKKQLEVRILDADDDSCTLPDISVQSRADTPYRHLLTFLDDTPHRVLFCTESAGRQEVLSEQLLKINLTPERVENWHAFSQSHAPLGITVSPIERGLILTDDNVALITEAQLFAEHIKQRSEKPQRVRDPNTLIRDLTELAIDAPVVHVDHGVGRYRGLQTVNEAEYLLLEYANEAKLYVPITSLDLIHRYTGADADHAPLHHLGSKRWQNEKQKATKKIRDVATELLDLYAKREAKPGHAHPMDIEAYTRFVNTFPFEETADQQRAINEVIGDMTRARAMDRLVCGDVGFGKTEVAMRAAFVAVNSGKQVAVLVPTTVLAEQHYQNFLDRFADWPVNIAALSRFRTAKEQQSILEALKRGKLDIVIGTHKLLQQSIAFKSLGLLIVDEEHRFGVKHKERLKALRLNVDILTLTATPIPRTLNMAMSGVRDISIIATPPAKRLAIKTFVRDYNDGLIREAILRENLRGGQVYFLHNNVKTIKHMAETLQALVPDAKIIVAHGQMREKELERIMTDFYHLRFNVLVCTTIIESGIDIPTANTIIINRADKLGLAQLHQLRGRVGRSHHQAYAYLLTPEDAPLTKDAEKRLDALASMEGLGTGFMLATHDLEIRGAGELLGESQSGQMHEIGFSLYMQLLDQAVSALRKGTEPDFDTPLQHGTEIDLNMPALIPEDYLPDIHLRLTLYKRIASAKDHNALRELKVEMIDRFGSLPAPLTCLFELTALKLRATQQGITKITASREYAYLHFSKQPNLDIKALLTLIQTEPHAYQLQGTEKLRMTLPSEAPAEARISAVESLLTKIGGNR